jgi:O-methyltransferase
MPELDVGDVCLLGRRFKLYGYRDDRWYQDVKNHGSWGEFNLEHLTALIRPDAVCFDLGANVGTMTLAMAALAPRGHVYACEASTETAVALAQTVRANHLANVTVLETVIGKENEQVRFFDTPTMRSSGAAVPRSIAAYPYFDAYAIDRTCRSVDSLVAELGLDHVDLIKLDIEGAELDALDGARSTLARFRPIVLLEFNSYAFTHLREIPPRQALTHIFETFDEVYFFEKRVGALHRIEDTEQARERFLNDNLFGGFVDDLLCCAAGTTLIDGRPLLELGRTRADETSIVAPGSHPQTVGAAQLPGSEADGPVSGGRSPLARAIFDALESRAQEDEAFTKIEAERLLPYRTLAVAEAPLRRELDDAFDEIRRLKIKLEEVPQIDYQALMERIAKEHAFSASDPAFYALYEQTKSFTMTSIERMYALYKAVEYISRAEIPGEIVECGVWRGGSMMLAALTLLKLGDVRRRLILFDTFAGHPRPDPVRDAQANFDEWLRRRRTDESSDWAAVSLDEVRKNLQSTGYPAEKIIFIQGVVEKTIVPNRPDMIALLRLDTDWYESTAHELKYLYPLLADQGGIILIDDYGSMPGAQQAVEEYFKDWRDAPLLNRIDFTGVIGVKLHPVPDPGD